MDTTNRKFPRYFTHDKLYGGIIHLNFNELYYTGFNELNLLLDPFCDPPTSPSIKLEMLCDYTERTTTRGVAINIFAPSYLNSIKLSQNYLVHLEKEPENNQNLALSKAKKNLESKSSQFPISYEAFVAIANRSKLNKDVAEDLKKFGYSVCLYQKGGLKLFDAYNALACDALITDNTVLLNERNKERMIEDALIISWDEICEFVEKFLSGHGLYIGSAGFSNSNTPILGLRAHMHYAMVDKDFRRYQDLFSALCRSAQDERAHNFFRVAFFQRYQFMLHAKDRIHFEIFQSKKADLLYQSKQAHYFMASYHLNTFYLMLWGYLDNLAWGFNYMYGFGYDHMSSKGRSNCTFTKKEYLKKLHSADGRIHNMVAKGKFADWFEGLMLKRHPAAHREPLFLSTLVDSEDKKVIGDKLIMGEKESRVIFYEAIDHLDYDFSCFKEMMNQLCKLFKV